MAVALPYELAATTPAPTVAADATLTFDDLYAAQLDFVWVVLRRLGVPVASLEDAAQDVFVVVYRRLEAFDGPSYRAWLFGIALRVARDHRRRAQRKDRGLEPLVDEGHAAETPGPLDLAVRGEAIALLGRLLDTLDDDKREVFVMAELEQLSVPEMVTILGVNANTLYARLRAARAEFNAALARHQKRVERP